MIQPPRPDEYAEYFGRYIQRVPPESDIFALFATQPDELRALLQNITDEQANRRPAPGEWSIKEVVGHLNDVERIFAYRLFWIARGDTTPLPGFEQDDFVRGTDFNQRSLSSLIDEFSHQRQANVLCFTPLTQAEIDRRGTASRGPFSARALLYVLVGHVIHHIESLMVDYNVKGIS